MDKCLSDHIKELGAVLQPTGRTAALELAILIWDKALRGDRFAIQMVWERLEGRPALGRVPMLPEKELDDKLQQALDRVYEGREGTGVAEGAGEELPEG